MPWWTFSKLSKPRASSPTQEFEALKAKVTKDEQKAAEEQQAAVQQAVQQVRPATEDRCHAELDAAADNDVTMMTNGVGFHTGRFDVSISGEVNGFYVQDRADNIRKSDLLALRSQCQATAGRLRSAAACCRATSPSRSRPRNTAGMLQCSSASGRTSRIAPRRQRRRRRKRHRPPSAPLVSTSVNSSPPWAMPTSDTLKIGRDLGLFGQEAILNDMTLLGAGYPASQ